MYDPAPARTGRRGRPAKHGKQLSVETDFTLSNKRIGDYYTGVRLVLTKIFAVGRLASRPHHDRPNTQKRAQGQ